MSLMNRSVTATTSSKHLVSSAVSGLLAGLLVSALPGCSNPADPNASAADELIKSGPLTNVYPTSPPVPTTRLTPIGLALSIVNGQPTPLSVRQGQTFYLNQIDLRESINTSVDEGVSGLSTQGSLTNFSWAGVSLVDTQMAPTPNPDGTLTRRRFYRGAPWMEQAASFTLTQLDASGHETAPPIMRTIGPENQRSPLDAFFIRRTRAIQFTNNCSITGDCSAATSFTEEAILEVRDANEGYPTFQTRGNTTAFQLTWTVAGRAQTYVFPITQVAAPPYDYGFDIELTAVTPPRSDGTYAPDSDVTISFSLRDASGTQLHPDGSMPTANEVYFGPNPAGLNYYNGFFETFLTYWRRKHKEAQLFIELIGPAQNVQPLRTVLQFGDILQPVGTSGMQSRDGVFAQGAMVPPATVLFTSQWDAPVANQTTFHIAPDAQPGTYFVTMKGRRTYMGEDIPFTRVASIQVGTPQKTQANLGTGGCEACHNGGSSFEKVLHANTRRDTCAGCHPPLVIELEGPIYVRTHFLHSRSEHFAQSNVTNCSQQTVQNCSNCHLTNASIQRTSKSACLSCHTSYPTGQDAVARHAPDHVAMFGPVTDPYVGSQAGDEFQQCTSTCHTTHPGSNLFGG